MKLNKGKRRDIDGLHHFWIKNRYASLVNKILMEMVSTYSECILCKFSLFIESIQVLVSGKGIAWVNLYDKAGPELKRIKPLL